MYEKTEVDQEYDKDEDTSQSSGNLPEHQYSREQLINISKNSIYVKRPKCLDPAYDAEDGIWDPDRWYKAQFEQSGETSPLTLADGKDRRRTTDLDRDIKRRTSSVNDPVERLKDERDGIVLGPQRRSFGTGCHVQTPPVYTRQLTLPDRDRDESRIEKERDRERDRERPVRKIGSGRIQIDRENSRDYTGLRDRFDERDVRERDQERDRDFNWNRDREREWDRDPRDTDWDRERRFDRNERFRRVGDRDFPDRRDREFHGRGFDRNPRRRNYREEEREPEWFTGGPSSQNDTIELRGFEREGACDGDEARDGKTAHKNENTKRVTPSDDKSSKESSEETSESDVKVSQRSSPEEDQQILQSETQEQKNRANLPKDDHRATTPQQKSGTSPTNHKLFDFDEILKATSYLPLNEEPIYQGSRFSRFFSGVSGNQLGSDTSSMEDMLMPHDLLEDNHTSPAFPSPTSMIGHMGAGPTHQRYEQVPIHQQHDPQGHNKENMFSLHQNHIPVPNSAGDNRAGFEKLPVPPSVTAFFNSAALGGANPSTTSSTKFSTQDAEAQLKAMLFGGHKDSASSSGTASPASLPPSVQRKVKTVAELEADMHQNSPQRKNSSYSIIGGTSSPTNSGDMTAFNKLLIMMNAASEANQNVMDPQISSGTGFGMVPSHNEFSHAVMRNKEEQIQLQQQSLHSTQMSFHPQAGMQHPPPPFYPHQQMSIQTQQQPPPPLVNQHLRSAASFQQLQQQQTAMNNPKQIGLVNKLSGTPGLHQTMSSSQNIVMKPRAQNGGPMMSSDPIFNLIQQNPTIVMNPASPGPNMAAILASQQSAVSNTSRVPSPLMFSQQPPLHLSAPSPIHPGQLSPRSLTVGNNLASSSLNSPTGMRSPVLHRVLSPQELSAHAQAVMQGALIKKQLQDQSERYMKKQQEREKSPSQQQFQLVRAQTMTQPPPPSKNMPMNTFTPTSVLRKMHSDKALEKERHTLDGRSEEELELISSMHGFAGGQNDIMDSRSLDGNSRKCDQQFLEDLCDISFLDPINPDLVTVTNQLENQLRVGQTNILPGSLSQPMSVEEKMKLSLLAEKPGYLSQMLDKSAKAAAAAEAARSGHGRPIVKAQEPSQEERNLQQNFYALQQQQPPPTMLQGGRPVTGGSPMMQPSYGLSAMQSNLAQLSNLQQNTVGSKPTGGRAIVGGNSIQNQSQVPMIPTQNIDVLRMLELQRLQQMPHSQGMVLPPPPMGTPISCLGPPPGTVPVSVRIPVVGAPVHPATMMHPQVIRVNTMNAQQHNQQISHFLAMQQGQQHRAMTPLPSHHMVVPGVPGPMSPRGQATGPLSPAALSATIQRVASPHSSLKMNGPHPMTPSLNGAGGPKVDLNSGIQRWFSPDILKTQLPSMPPIPTKGNHVLTLDELEGN